MEWISVEDRLPLELDSSEIYRDVTVLVVSGYYVSVNKFESGSVGESWRAWSEYGDIKPNEITHWMPLPNPPKT